MSSLLEDSHCHEETLLVSLNWIEFVHQEGMPHVLRAKLRLLQICILF